MFYTPKVLFVHMPRTAGTWLSQWAFHNLRASVDDHFLKHLNRDRLVETLPCLKDLTPFTIVREEEERFQSWLRHCRGFCFDRLETEEWRTIVYESRTLDESEFRTKRFCPNQAFLCDGMKVFPFEKDLDQCIRWLLDVHSGASETCSKRRDDCSQSTVTSQSESRIV